MIEINSQILKFCGKIVFTFNHRNTVWKWKSIYTTFGVDSEMTNKNTTVPTKNMENKNFT